LKHKIGGIQLATYAKSHAYQKVHLTDVLNATYWTCTHTSKFTHMEGEEEEEEEEE
jgi:hypothetical protein